MVSLFNFFLGLQGISEGFTFSKYCNPIC